MASALDWANIFAGAIDIIKGQPTSNENNAETQAQWIQQVANYAQEVQNIAGTTPGIGIATGAASALLQAIAATQQSDEPQINADISAALGDLVTSVGNAAMSAAVVLAGPEIGGAAAVGAVAETLGQIISFDGLALDAQNIEAVGTQVLQTINNWTNPSLEIDNDTPLFSGSSTNDIAQDVIDTFNSSAMAEIDNGSAIDPDVVGQILNSFSNSFSDALSQAGQDANAEIDAVTSAANSILGQMGNFLSSTPGDPNGGGNSGSTGSGGSSSGPGGSGSGSGGSGSGSGGSGSGGAGSGSGNGGGGGAAQQGGGDMNGARQDKDPIVLDLAGTGLNLTSLSPTSTLFDYSGDGFASRTAWVGSGTGILVWNPSGAPVTDQSQLVTSISQLSSFDTNGDGVINQSDSAYQDLKVWVGSSTSGFAAGTGEFLSLADLGIVSIDLTFSTSDQIISGNNVSAVGTFTLVSGAQQTIAAVDLTDSSYATVPDTRIAESDQVLALPNVGGSGTLYDLRSSMMNDATLIQQVQAFASLPGTDPDALESAARAIMFEWAGVSTVDPTSRGGDVNAQELGFLEKYLGEAFVASDGGYTGNSPSDPGIKAGGDIFKAWTGIYDATLTRLVLQSASGPSALPAYSYDASTDQVVAIGGVGEVLGQALERLGAPDSTNWSQWDLELRAADAVRLDAGISPDIYQELIALATDDTVASLASAIASGVSVTFGLDGM
jgi:hypothetical protein